MPLTLSSDWSIFHRNSKLIVIGKASLCSKTQIQRQDPCEGCFPLRQQGGELNKSPGGGKIGWRNERGLGHGSANWPMHHGMGPVRIFPRDNIIQCENTAVAPFAEKNGLTGLWSVGRRPFHCLAGPLRHAYIQPEISLNSARLAGPWHYQTLLKSSCRFDIATCIFFSFLLVAAPLHRVYIGSCRCCPCGTPTGRRGSPKGPLYLWGPHAAMAGNKLTSWSVHVEPNQDWKRPAILFDSWALCSTWVPNLGLYPGIGGNPGVAFTEHVRRFCISCMRTVDFFFS